nr:integrase, catalytic region, zinc finger, CCHC-type, peptidase aspartic, catalytic [Tanacetum cinerariifolium]
MSTRSTSSNLFSLLKDPESLIRRRNLHEPSSLFDFEEDMNNNHNNHGQPPVGPPPPQNNNGPPPVFPPSMVTKLRNKVTKFRQEPHKSLFEEWERYKLSIDRCPNHNMLAGGTFMQKTSKECYDLIKNMTAHHNHWDNSATRDETSRTTLDETSRTISSATTTESPEVIRQLDMLNKNFQEMMKQMQPAKAVDMKCETCGGTRSYTECPPSMATLKRPLMLLRINETNMRAVQNQITTMKNDFETSMAKRQNELKNMMSSFLQIQMQKPSGSGSLPSNTIANPRGELKAITTRSGVAYDGPTIPPTPSLFPKEVERKTEATKDKVQNKSLGSTVYVQPSVVQIPILELDIALKPKPSIPYPSRLNDQKLREKTNTVLIKKLSKKLGDPGRFLIPCDFQGLESCMALDNLGASINLMPLTSTRMTLELATWTYAYPTGIAEDVFVQVGKFTFPADFVVVDYDLDPHVPFILERPFLRTARALVDVYKEELILRDDDEQLIFYVDSISKHPHKHGNKSINMINFIDITCEDRFPEVLKFKKSNHPSSGTTIPFSDSSPSLTPFETSDYLFEEFANELVLYDLVPPGKEDNNLDFEADLREIEFLLNQDPSTESNIKTIDPILEKFTDETDLDYLPPPREEDDDLLTLNLITMNGKSFFVEDHIVESNDLLPRLLDHDSTLSEESYESSENASLCLFSFENEDKGLEVAFRKSACFVRNEDVVDLLTGDRSSNLYTIALNKVASNSSTCLLAKAFSSQSWLWHQRLSHLNFATINNLVKNNLVQGLPKMKFEKDHLCSACEQRKIHRKHHKSKTAFASNKPPYLLHMDLCGPMRVQSINGKRYVLVVVDDYSRTPQQNGVVERSNRTLVEAAGTMLTFANLQSFLWAEAIATACFTQNRSIIHKRFDKTPYELINKRKPNIKFFRVFGCRCYLLNDYEDVGKLMAKVDIGVFVGYSKESAAFRIYNKRTRKLHESVNVNFDEISEMASKQFGLEPGLSNLNETGKSSNRSVSKVDEALKNDLEDLFQDFYDEYFDSSKIMKSSTTNVETPIIEKVFLE